MPFFFTILVPVMAFLTTDDLTLSPEEINRLTAIDSDAFTNGFATAEAYLNDRLIHLYDMDAELAKTGTDRRLTLVKIGVKIAQWEAYKVAPQINIPAAAEYDYNEAMAQLNEIEQGKLLTNLAPQTDDAEKIGTVRYGTNDTDNILY